MEVKLNNFRFMTYSEVFKQWKENVKWVNGIINPYVIKEFGGIRPDPTYPGGFIARYDIIDRTFLIDDDVLDFTRSLHFPVRYFNGTDTEKQQEAELLQQELDDFLTATIAEREQELADLHAQGKVIQTSNPYAWK